MNCNECKDLLDSYLDEELSQSDHALVRAHLEACHSCKQHYEEKLNLRNAFQHLPRYSASQEFVQKIQAISLKEASQVPQPYQETGSKTLWATILTHTITACAAVLLTSFFLSSQFRAEGDKQQTVGAHIRGLMVKPIVQIRSSDQHQIKPWFGGKLNFSPQIKELQDKGFDLIGARTDYLQELTVAVLIYKRRQHIISVFILPAKKITARSAAGGHQNGYQYIHKQAGEFMYFIASDLNMDELKLFANLL